MSGALLLVQLLFVLVIFLQLVFFFAILAPSEVDEDILRIEETSDDKELGVDEASKDGGKEEEGEEEEDGRDY